MNALLTLIRMALAEDLGAGDITSDFFIAASHQSQSEIITRQPLVVAGLSVVLTLFAELDPQLLVIPKAKDGERRDIGDPLLSLKGSTRSILAGERAALNFLGRLSGIATWTRAHVDAAQGTGVTILDTRKTTPGWRYLEKEAVRAGGAKNHRMGLYDAMLIKDNHLAALRSDLKLMLPGYLQKARWEYPHLPIELEAETLEQVEFFLTIPAITTILLDNMSLPMLRQAVALRNKRAPAIRLEASGGISLANLRAVAETGVDEISLGALTHTAPWVDLSLELF